MYRGNVSLAKRYLEDKVSDGGISNYSLCLVAYALVLANSPVAATALAELSRRAHYRGKKKQKYPVVLCSGMFKSHISVFILFHLFWLII